MEKKIIAGQQETYGGGNDYNYELEFDYIKGLTGKLPSIRGFDFMNYNTISGWDDKTVERIIDWVKKKRRYSCSLLAYQSANGF